ncbi:MAG: type I restriction endonuclease subunit R, partial [Flavobacteriales bacterium]|nr:type I restriction endonuclease subunit R [Flavobacteriales bacterium]
QLLYKCTADKNELTGEEFPVVKLIDFQNWDKNRFTAINQFRIDTPGRVKEHIRPDLVLFVNGLPLVVVEAKDANAYTSDPMAEAIKQLHRYSEQREETRAAGLREGEERLFHTNQLLIASTGEQARFGTITSGPEHFYEWKSIHPEKYADFTPPLGKVRSQETLVQGMLNREVLLDLVRNFTLFMNAGERLVKVMARYQQYRAVSKIVERLRTGADATARSGTVWHTQGSGKSLTMVFLVRKLRRCADLQDFKVLLVIDRIDLEDQLGDTAALAEERVYHIDSSAALKRNLSDDRSNLSIVMIHKFREAKDQLPDYVSDVLRPQTTSQFTNDPVPEYNLFGTVNTSDRILMLVDEAHRTHGSELGDNLFEAFPNATRIAFTGTPLITDRHKKKTQDRFGTYIDKYKLQDAVEDGTTVQILYEGRTAETALKDRHDFDTKFEDLFGDLTPEQVEAIKKKYGASGDILEAEERITEIARDLVAHYIGNILPNGFKAQVVCHSKLAAVRYKEQIDKALVAWLEQERAKSQPDAELIGKVAFLQSVVVVSTDGTNEKAVIVAARKHAQEVGAVDNFKKSFDQAKPQTGIAFLIVCDMLLTGFDAPVEQVMYVDKRIKEHTLLQAIARVNRVAEGKSRGYVVDYIGLTGHLREALQIYSEEDRNEILDSLRNIKDEVPVLETRYQRLINLFRDKGVGDIQDFVEQRITDEKKHYAVLEQAVELMEDIKLRESFAVFYKKFLQSMDIILPHPLAQPFKIPLKRFGYLLSRVKERYKDDSLNIASAGEKVKKLVNEHLISLGIDPKIPPVELISPAFIKSLGQHKSNRAKASEMEHAIRKHCKVHFQEDPSLYKRLSDKLDALIQQHKEDWDALANALGGLTVEVQKGRGDAVSTIAASFKDMIADASFNGDALSETDLMALEQVTHGAVEKLRGTIHIVDFWDNAFQIKKLKGELSDVVLSSNHAKLIASSDKIVTEIAALAKVRHKDLLA